jgi:hypothetical protein
MIMMANSYTPVRVSTFPLEKRWQELEPANIQFASAYTMQDGGHQLYVLNIPGASETWVYDLTASTQLGKPIWTTWTTSNNNGSFGRHLGQGHAYTNGWHVTGDYSKGTVYAMDAETFTDDGKFIRWERTTPHIANQMNRIFYDRLTLDFFTGGTTDPNLNPQVMIQFSDDGGATWSNERWESAGALGEYDKRVEFFRLGSGRNRVFRIRCTDPMYWALSGASIDVRAGKN